MRKLNSAYSSRNAVTHTHTPSEMVAKLIAARSTALNHTIIMDCAKRESSPAKVAVSMQKLKNLFREYEI
jgi:hypothetical protein